MAIPLIFSILKIGTPLILLVTLYIFGITLGLLVTSGLVRFEPSFENIAWASLFLAPLGCIYYPIDVYQIGFKLSQNYYRYSYFEEMRNILIYDIVNYYQIFKAIFISFLYFIDKYNYFLLII